MMRFFRDKHGAVNVFLAIILVPVLVISCLFVDVSRAKLAGSLVSSAGDLTLNTVLTQYDPILNDYYGLLASCQTVDEFLATADDYFMACITSQGVDAAESRKYTDMIMNMIQGDGGEIADLLQLAESEGEKFTVNVAENGTLANPALMKKEIVEFMKYRAPVDMVSDIIDKFRECSGNLENAQNDAELTEKKQEFFETEGELMKEALKVYDCLLEYKNLNISASDIAEMKKTLEGAEELYKELHIKMVMDLYNTQGKSFSGKNLLRNYMVSESDVKKDQVNGYINDTAKSMQDFIVAAKALDSAFGQMPQYESGVVYNIQYFVACVDILNQGDTYNKFVHKANVLIKNMTKLTVVMGMLDETEKKELHTFKDYPDVNTSGEKSREEHYNELSKQYDELKDKYMTQDSAYDKLTNRLSDIWEQNRDKMNPEDTNRRLQDFYKKINEYYSKYDAAYSLIDKSVERLNSLKALAQEYQNKYEAWSTKAGSYESSLSEEDEEYLNNEENREILEKVTPQNVEAMIQRLNNIKSLIGSVKKAVEEYEYNDYPVCKIDSYSKMRSESGVDETKISYITSELRQYAEASFRFTDSDSLEKIGITDKNNPAIAEVNTPELYKWMEEKFREYEKDKKNNESEEKKSKAEDNKREEEERYGDIDKDYGNYVDGNEIQGQKNLPSDGRQAEKTSDIISNDISKISGFVTGLFSNFGTTVNKSLVALRDDLYALDYIMNMFSYDTFENEGKFKLCSDVNLENWQTKYEAVDDQWKNTNVKYSDNKSLTNKMIDSSNNYAYGSEVEYILYGKSNAENKASAYGTIFAIRYVLNLPAEFGRYWTPKTADATALDGTAQAIQTASYGTIPAALVKLIVILGLTAAESARDLLYLQKGMPLKLVKDKDELEIHYPFDIDNNEKKEVEADTFFYSDYLKLILFLKLTAGDEYAIYARVADVIQVNMNQKISSPFVMTNANVYYKATVTMTVEPLMLKLPVVNNAGYDAPADGGWNTITYKAVRGY